MQVNGYNVIHAGNISSQSVNYATSAGSASSVAWTNVSGRPTAVSSFTNDSGYITSSGSCASATSATNATNLLPENTPHYFRSASGWQGGVYWGSAGTESMSFIVRNINTRFQFVCNSDMASWGSNTWSTVTPALTIQSTSSTFAGTVYSNSDRQLKKNIKNIFVSTDLEAIFNISDKIIKTFTWKNTGKTTNGFIAQELWKYIPEAVDTQANGIKTVSYNIACVKILAAAINEIKKLKKEIQELKGYGY